MSISFRLDLIKSNQKQDNQKKIFSEKNEFHYFSSADEEEAETGWIHFSFQEKWVHRLKKPIYSKNYEHSDLKKFIDAFVDLIFPHEKHLSLSTPCLKSCETFSNSSNLQKHLVAQLSAEIECYEKSLSPEHGEYHFLSSPYDGLEFAIDAKNNSYDNEMILKILTAAKFEKRDFYIKCMAKLSACFPVGLEQDKLDFIQIFSHLFLTKRFPNEGSFHRLCDLLGLHALTFRHSHYNS